MSVPPELLSGAAGVAVGAGVGLLTGNPLFGIMAGMSAAGGLSAAGAQSSQAEALSEQSRYAKLAGAEESTRVRRAGLKLVGQQIANYGASGIVGGQGSPATVMGDTLANTELTALDALQNAHMRAVGLQYESGLEKQKSFNTLISTGADILTTGAKLGAFDKKPTVPNSNVKGFNSNFGDLMRMTF